MAAFNPNGFLNTHLRTLLIIPRLGNNNNTEVEDVDAIFAGLIDLEATRKNLEEKASTLAYYFAPLDWCSEYYAWFIDDLQYMFPAYYTELIDDLRNKAQYAPDLVDILYKLGKAEYLCCNYEKSAFYLALFGFVCVEPIRSLHALWGKFACEMMVGNWARARFDFMTLKAFFDAIKPANELQRGDWLEFWSNWIHTVLLEDENTFASPLGQLESQIWLLHWSIFLFFNLEQGRKDLINLFCQDRYMEVIEKGAPHLLRYLAIAFVFEERNGVDFVRFMSRLTNAYEDPVLEFLLCIHVKQDPDAGLAIIGRCTRVISNDPFIGGRVGEEGPSAIQMSTFCTEFLDRAIMVISECRNRTCLFFGNTIPNEWYLTQEEGQSSSPFERLSDDVLKHVLSLLPYKNRVQVQGVSKRFASVVSSFEDATFRAPFLYHIPSKEMARRVCALMQPGENVRATLRRVAPEDNLTQEKITVFRLVAGYCGMLYLRGSEYGCMITFQWTKEYLESKLLEDSVA